MQGSDHKPYTKFHRWLRSLLLVCSLIAAALVGGWLFVKEQVHDEIRREIERRFVEANPNVRVSLRSARLIEGRGVEMLGISISRQSDGSMLAYIDEVFAAGNVDLQQLLVERATKTDALRVRGLRIWAERDKDGSWNVNSLWPLPKFGKTLPPLTVENSIVEIIDRRGKIARKLSLREIHLNVKSLPPTKTAPIAGRKGVLKIEGTFSGEDFELAEFTAGWDQDNGTWSCNGELVNARWSQSLLQSLPDECQQYAKIVPGLNGRIDASYNFADNRDQRPVQFSVDGQFSQGEILDERLPHRLFDLQTRFHLDNQQVRIEDLTARNGKTTVMMSFHSAGYAADSPKFLKLQAREIVLDDRFVEVLPADFQTAWRKFYPAGRVDANVSLRFDGKQWHPQFDVQCLDTSFVFYKFPYRLERTRGSVRLVDNNLRLDLHALASGQTIHIAGQVENPGPDFTGYIDIHSDGPIPVNRKLLDAIVDPKMQAVVNSLSLGGMVSVSGRFERQNREAFRMSKHLVAKLHNCTMQYEKFRYPIGLIQGSVVWDDQGLTFQDLSGRNDSGYIECDGFWRPLDQGGSLLQLNLVGTAIPLENELRDALNPGARRLWNDARLSGALDHLKVELQYASARRQLSLDVRGQQWKPKQNEQRRGISMHPTWFPYRLDEVAGVAHYRNGVITLENVSAVHNNTRIAVQGGCNVEPDGRWSVNLRDLSVDRIHFDRDLLAALPRGLGQAVAKLNLEGAVNMHGAIGFNGSGETAGKPPNANWNVSFDVENGRMQCGMDLRNIHGQVRLFGSGGADGFFSRGELNIDSLISKNIQITQLQGPLLIDKSGVVFGREADVAAQGRQPRSLQGRAFKGILLADVGYQFAGDSPFVVNARLQRADMSSLADDLAPQPRNVSGKIDARLDLRGTSQGVHSWRGGGNVRLYEANIYEVPVMLAMLKVLSIRQPDTTAFTSSNIDYRVQGQHVYLDRINFDGDAISLKGSGEMTLDRDVNLKFYTLVGRDELSIPVVRRMLSKASQQLLLIYVTGTLDKPEVTNEALPMLKETLDQIFPERGRLRQARQTTAESR